VQRAPVAQLEISLCHHPPSLMTVEHRSRVVGTSSVTRKSNLRHTV
jgi:hypothetical protein